MLTDFNAASDALETVKAERDSLLEHIALLEGRPGIHMEAPEHSTAGHLGARLRGESLPPIPRDLAGSLLSSAGTRPREQA